MAHQKLRRNTLQRQVILDELCKLTTHPTASQLYETVQQRLPKISLGTVYRNLELLSKVNLIQKLEYGGAEARFDGMTDHHYHVRCTSCGRIDDIHGLPANLIDEDVGSDSGFEILGHRLEFVGLCPDCQSLQDQENEEIPRAADG